MCSSFPYHFSGYVGLSVFFVSDRGERQSRSLQLLDVLILSQQRGIQVCSLKVRFCKRNLGTGESFLIVSWMHKTGDIASFCICLYFNGLSEEQQLR